MGDLCEPVLRLLELDVGVQRAASWIGHCHPWLAYAMAKPQRPTTCIGCGEPVQASMKQGVSSGVHRRTRHLEPVADVALRCRYDAGPDDHDEALEPYPGDVA